LKQLIQELNQSSVRIDWGSK